MKTSTTILRTGLIFGTIAAGLFLGSVVCAQAAPASPQGVITEKVFLDIGGGVTVPDLTSNAKFPDHPDLVNYRAYFELWATGGFPPDGVFDNYGSQIVGYFYPPETKDYVFYLCADDGADLYLSTDSNPANKRLIAQETTWSSTRNYSPWSDGGGPGTKRSDQFAGTQWPGGSTITLTKGQPYYIEALHKEGSGGDNLSVSIDGALPIPGTCLSSIDKNSGPVTIVTPPQSQTIDEGQPVTFTVVADGTPPYSYAWSRSGVSLSGATSTSYSIDRVTRADNGAVFSVAVNGGLGTTSANATLTVNPDLVPPAPVWAGGSLSFTTVTVIFSEPLDPATAQVAANYEIAGLTVSAAAPRPMPNDNVVVLTTSQQTPATEYMVSVKNVRDVAGNAIPAGRTARFKSFVFEPGWASYERWHSENGYFSWLDEFAAAIASGNIREPDYISQVPQFSAPWYQRWYYCARVFAWFTPPASGDYVFFVASDDASDVFLSTDESPVNKKLIAQETAWSNPYQFTTPGDSVLAAKRSDQFTGSEWPSGNTISLTAGKRYYTEILLYQGTGGDGADVTFINKGDADPANDASSLRMYGGVIAAYVPPPAVPVAFAKANPNPAEIGQVIQLDGSESYHRDPARRIVSWEWDLNNDGQYDATGPVVPVTFTSKGVHVVTLRLTDDSSPPQSAETTVEVAVAKQTIPWKATSAGELTLTHDGQGNVTSATVHEAGVATHVGEYTETVWLTSATTGDVEIRAANGDKLLGHLLHLSPVEVQVTIVNGTGRFEGAVGRYVAKLTMTGERTFIATTTGAISNVGSNGK